jgi:hypothetical protein
VALDDGENVSCENWNIAFLKFAALAVTMHPWETALGPALRQKGTRRDSFLKRIVISLAAAGVLKGNEFVCENYRGRKKMGVTV